MGIIPGLFYNRYGPALTIWIGVVMTCIGYASLGGIATQYLAITSAEFACFSNFLFALGTAWLCCAAIPLIAQNFPERDHGKLLGLGKAYLGIGGAFFAAFKTDLCNGDIDMYMLSTFIFIAVSSLISGWFMVQLPPKLADHYLPGEISNTSIAWWYISSTLFVIYLVVLGVLQSVYSFGADTRYLTICI